MRPRSAAAAIPRWRARRRSAAGRLHAWGLQVGTVVWLGTVFVLAFSALVWAQSAVPPTPPPALPAGVTSRVPPEQFAPLTLSNRPIVTFKASVVPRTPASRADGARRALATLVDQGATGPVTAREAFGASIVSVAGQDVFAIVPDDIDGDAGESLEQVTNEAMANLRLALAEAAEARAPWRLARAAAVSLAAMAALALLLTLLIRARRRLSPHLQRVSHRVLGARFGGEVGHVLADRAFDAGDRTLRLATSLIAVAAIYVCFILVLRQFPYTRPWGETAGGYLADTVVRVIGRALSALPGLFTVAIVFLITRFVVRLANLVFLAVERHRLDLPGLSAGTAAATRRLTTGLLWVFAIVAAYPYVPGSQTDAFRGVAVFSGLVISLGASSVVHQVISGFVLTYSRALEPGDYVRVGDVEGTVTQLGLLSAKVKTPRREEVTIPNAVVLGGTAVNYSRFSGEGVYVPTTISIGYDVPWRQVKAMLIAAAARTDGVRQDRPPIVAQTNLGDFAVEYALLVCIEQPEQRVPLLTALRAHVQDVFNEHGVQIMTPHYEGDPATPKLAPHAREYSAPADRAAGARAPD
jgi:small-conductance mechanosensitive channel